MLPSRHTSKSTPHCPTIPTGPTFRINVLYPSTSLTNPAQTSIILPSELLRTMKTLSCTILVVGSGNAGFSAALSAAQNLSSKSPDSKVLLIDKCPSSWAGGNSHFTAGAFRTVHSGLSDLLPLVTNVDSETAKVIDLEPYTKDDFLGDMERVTHGRYDKTLGRVLVEESNEVVKWLAGLGLGFELSFNRQVHSCPRLIRSQSSIVRKQADIRNRRIKSTTAINSLAASPSKQKMVGKA